MRKIIIPFIIIISLVIISLLFFMPKQKEVTNEEKETNEPITEVISWKKQMKQKYPYFIDDYEQRYKRIYYNTSMGLYTICYISNFSNY